MAINYNNLYLTGHFLEDISFGSLDIDYTLCCGSPEIFVVNYTYDGNPGWGKQIAGILALVDSGRCSSHSGADLTCIFLSLAGLFCALLGIYYAIRGVFPAAMIGILWAVVFDWFDGVIARRIKDRTLQQRAVGAQLDSLIAGEDPAAIKHAAELAAAAELEGSIGPT